MQVKNSIKLLYFGDLVGRSGRSALINNISEIKSKYKADAVFTNAENAAGGRGLNQDIAKELLRVGVDSISLGDHVWDQKCIIPLLNDETHNIIAPANLPTDETGLGYKIVKIGGTEVLHINLLGRVFVNLMSDCPFKKITKILSDPSLPKIKILDFHAEATSEKYAMLRHLSGKISLLVGTHTHVQTADQHIVDGTGYITDMGMCGDPTGVIGVDAKGALGRFLGQSIGFKPGTGPGCLSGVFAEFDIKSGQCIQIERVYQQY